MIKTGLIIQMLDIKKQNNSNDLRDYILIALVFNFTAHALSEEKLRMTRC